MAFLHATPPHKAHFSSKTKQNLHNLHKSTVNCGLERCIFSRFLIFGFFHLSPTLIVKGEVFIFGGDHKPGLTFVEGTSP